jgi:uncharacterized protein YndB with AHSA1/START domain
MTLQIDDTKVVIDRDTHSIIFARVVAAPRERVFEAWTRPEKVTCWWDAAGDPLAKCEIDLRPGGAFKFVSQTSLEFAGVYREIAPPQRLVFEAMGALGRVDLEGADGKTLLTVRITCSSAEHLEQFLKMGVDVGTSRTLDNLGEYFRADISAMSPRASTAR